MPFTPLHMGPGLVIKALFRGSFSLVVFGVAQIIMDLQPLFVILTGQGHLHGFSHTCLGATLIGGFSMVLGKYFAEWLLARLPLPPVTLSWKVVGISAFLGTYTHVLLDTIMHADLLPWYPFSSHNELLYLLSHDALNLTCLITGLLGGAVCLIYLLIQKKQDPPKDNYGNASQSRRDPSGR